MYNDEFKRWWKFLNTDPKYAKECFQCHKLQLYTFIDESGICMSCNIHNDMFEDLSKDDIT